MVWKRPVGDQILPSDGIGIFAYPRGVATDTVGNVYVADTGNNRIQRVTADGNLLTDWGRDGSLKGDFLNPSAVAIDSIGNVYVADSDNHRIQLFYRP